MASLRETACRALDAVNVRLVSWRVGAGEGLPRPVPAAPSRDDVTMAVTLSAIDGDPRPAGRDALGERWVRSGSSWVASRLAPRTRATSRRAVILLHGWLATSLQLHHLAAIGRGVRERCEIWMPRLPAHLERTPPGAVSGQRCLSSDLVATVDALRTAVAETRWLARHLRARGARVGIWGVSLGGWVAALACRQEVCDRLVLWAPVVDPQATLWESDLGAVLAASFRSSAVSPSSTSELFGELAPIAHGLAIPGDAIRVIGAEYDNVVSIDSLRDAATRWNTTLEVLRHGHISLLLSRRARAGTVDAFRAL